MSSFFSSSSAIDEIFRRIEELYIPSLNDSSRVPPKFCLINANDINPQVHNYTEYCIRRWQVFDTIFSLVPLDTRYLAVKLFREVGRIMKSLWKELELTLGPAQLLGQLQEVAKINTISLMCRHGISTIVGNLLLEILNLNTGKGGSYGQFAKILFRTLGSGHDSSSVYTHEDCETLVIDTINSFSSCYNLLIAADMDAEWFTYRNSNLINTRPFCLAMKERQYFHVSEIESLLTRGLLEYTTEEGKRNPVPRNPSTNLPYGMRPNTTASEFLVLRGGIKCGHSISPVSETLVKVQKNQLYQEITQSVEYRTWNIGGL